MSAQHKDEFGELLYEAFRFSTWEASPENARRIERLRGQMMPHLGRYPGLLRRFEHKCAQGEQARALTEELEKRLHRDGNGAQTRAWLDQATLGRSKPFRDHLEKQLRRFENRQQARVQRQAADPGVPFSTIRQIRVAHGQNHPNSLRHLDCSPQWTVLIDETGERFDEQAGELAYSDRRLGRLVALAVPAGIALPTRAGFHAAESTAAEVDEVVGTLLAQPVGVFGFTVHDPVARATSWIHHVITLGRWTLTQLPLAAGASAQVDVLIEQRAEFGAQLDLSALRDMLESEMRSLSPQRYERLNLNIRFMDKSEALNGYVDAIAFTWGSPTSVSRDRLKKTAWLGHCLLRPSDDALERLYLALHGEGELSAPQWYELCAAAGETADGALDDALARLGENLAQGPNYWNRCLSEVRRRMQAKEFSLRDLGLALSWLERWAAPGNSLPAAQQLMLETTRLASDNHRGKVDADRVERCLALADALHDESPAEACEAILRIAVATTNVFDFEMMRATVQSWLTKPVAIPGLLNHGKLQSTLGQIEAFTGNGAGAIACFDRAIAAFQRLSDRAQAKREIAQTNIYRLIAMLDLPVQPAQTLLAELSAHFHAAIRKSAPVDISRSLAHSGQSWRFSHHLWLRALVAHPATLADARTAYIEQHGAWQDGDGHPWPLIDAYRAWLLRDFGENREAAMRLSTAIEQCASDDNGPALRWMGAVLQTLAVALQIRLPEKTVTDSPQLLQALLPAAPHGALAEFVDRAHDGRCADEDIHAALRACLPFNFH